MSSSKTDRYTIPLDEIVVIPPPKRPREGQRRFNPNQPRDPGGEGGGQWVKVAQGEELFTPAAAAPWKSADRRKT